MAARSLSTLVRRPTAAAAPDPRTTRARRLLCAAALALAPVLLLVAALVELDVSDTAATAAGQIAGHRGRFLLGEMLFAAGVAALIPGAIALASLVRGRGAAWMTTGACMVAVGGGSMALGIWAYGVVGYVGTSSGVPRSALVALLDKGDNSPVVGLSWILGAGALLGMIVVAVGLIRARAVPLWEPILLIVAPILTFFGGGGVLGAFLGLPLVIALVALAGEVVRAERTAAAPGHIDLTAVGDAGLEMPSPRRISEPAGRDRSRDSVN